MRRLLWAALLALVVPAGLHAQGTILLTEPFDDADFPDYNGTAIATDARWTRHALAADAPCGGGDSVQYEHLSAAVGSFGGDYGFGVNYSLSSQSANFPADGGSVFVRFRFKVSSDTNWQGRDQSDGSDVNYIRTKVVMWPNSGSDASGMRVVFHTENQNGPITGQYLMRLGDGSTNWQTAYSWARGSWYAVQYEIQFSNPSTGNNGELRIWVNNDTYASPTQQRSGSGGTFVNSVTGQDIRRSEMINGNLRIGAYENNGLQSDGIHKQHFADFEVGTAFDSAWYSDCGSESGGPDPVSIRKRWLRIASLFFTPSPLAHLVHRR